MRRWFWTAAIVAGLTATQAQAHYIIIRMNIGKIPGEEAPDKPRGPNGPGAGGPGMAAGPGMPQGTGLPGAGGKTGAAGHGYAATPQAGTGMGGSGLTLPRIAVQFPAHQP